MTPDKLTRFIKLMGMTGSIHDGEALNALRMANAILAETGMSWEEFIKGRVTVQMVQMGQPSPPPRSGKIYKDAEEIDECFEILLEGRLSESFRGFVESVHSFWQERGYLTEAQYKAIRQAAERQR